VRDPAPIAGRKIMGVYEYELRTPATLVSAIARWGLAGRKLSGGFRRSGEILAFGIFVSESLVIRLPLL
jgi:hypothetical protein